MAAMTYDALMDLMEVKLTREEYNKLDNAINYPAMGISAIDMIESVKDKITPDEHIGLLKLLEPTQNEEIERLKRIWHQENEKIRLLQYELELRLQEIDIMKADLACQRKRLTE